MLRRFIKNKKHINLRKHHPLPPRINQPIIKKTGNFKYEELIDYSKIDFYNKNKYSITKQKNFQEKIKKKIKNLNKEDIRYKKMPESYINSLYENFEYDDETKILKNVCFEEEIKIIKNLKNQKGQKFEQFQNIIKSMVTNLNLLNEYEVLQFQKHSVSLRISDNFTDQAKGILLKISLEEILQKNFKNENEKEKTLKNLIDKIALKMVYNKIEEIIIKKQKGSSYERNDVLDFFMKDPLYEPNGILIKKVISQIYSESSDFEISKNSDFLNSSENQIKLKLEENYFKARARFICEFLGLSVFDYYDFDGFNIGLNYPLLFRDIENNKKKEFDVKNENFFEIIHVQLQKILGHFEVNKDLNSKITNLERSLKTYDHNLPNLDIIANQLNLLIHELPDEIKNKFFSDEIESEQDFRYVNNDFNYESLQWKNLDLEIPSSIMPVAYQLENTRRKSKRNKVLLMKEANEEENLEEKVDKDLEYDTKQEFYDNSDLEIDDNLTEIVNNNFPDAKNRAEVEKYEEILTKFSEKEEELAKKMERKELNLDKNVGRLTKNVPDDDDLNPIHKKLVYRDISDEYISTIGEMQEIMEIEQENENSKNLRKKEILKKRRNEVKKRVSDLYSKNRFSKKFVHKNIYTNEDEEYESLEDMVKPTLEKYTHEDDEDDYQQLNYEYNIQINRKFKLEIEEKKKFKKKGIFEVDEKKDLVEDGNFSLTDNYQYAIEFYKEFNSSLFFKHYIAENYKNTNKFNPEKKIDQLIKEDDPNIGLYLQNEKEENQNNFLDIKKDKENIVNSILNPIDPKQLENETNSLLTAYFGENKEILEKQKLKKNYFGKGRRKKAKALALLQTPGSGKIKINNREFSEYFFNSSDRYHLIKPIIAAGKECEVDIQIFVYGSGLSKQSEAAKVALSKAMLKAFPEFEKHFFDLFLTFTDDRRVERKKTGKPKARKGVTYVRR